MSLGVSDVSQDVLVQLCVASGWDTGILGQGVMGIQNIKASPLSLPPILEHKLTYGHMRQYLDLLNFYSKYQS